MRTVQSFRDANRRSKHAEKMQCWRAAKAAKHERDTAGMPVRDTLAGKLVWTITIHDRLTGKMQTLDLRVSQKRNNSFGLSVNGEPIYRRISASQIAQKIRKKISPRWLTERG